MFINSKIMLKVSNKMTQSNAGNLDIVWRKKTKPRRSVGGGAEEDSSQRNLYRSEQLQNCQKRTSYYETIDKKAKHFAIAEKQANRPKSTIQTYNKPFTTILPTISLTTRLLLILCLVTLPTVASSYSLSISSSEPYTGVAANYYFTLQNHSNPTNLVFTFSAWSPNLDEPFTSAYRIMDNATGNGLTCTKRFRNVIECNLSALVFSGGSYPSTINLKMTNIYNPSSLKPYPISVYTNGTGGTDNQTANLIVYLPRMSSIFIDNYSPLIGQKSTSQLYLDFRNYLTSTTILNLTYNGSLVTIDMVSDSSYSIVTDALGVKKLTGWSPALQVLKTLRINITNPGVAVGFAIEGMLYVVQNGVEYKIQSYSIAIQPSALPYKSYGSVAPLNKLSMGSASNNLSLFAQCSLTTVNGPTKNSYFQISYDNTLMTITNTSNCIASSTNGNTSSCTLGIPSNAAMANNSFSVSSIYQLIPSSVVVQNVWVKIKSWSYFSPMAQFYAVCESTFVVDVLPQTLTPTVALSTCVQTVGAENTLTIEFNVQNVQASDILVMKSFPGKIINKTGSQTVTYNTLSNQYESTINSSQIITPSKVRFTLTLMNPTYVPSQQPTIQLYLSRKLTSANASYVTYAQTSTPLLLCPVTTQLTSSSPILTLSSQTTYQAGVMYYLELTSVTLQLRDYNVNDYFVVEFRAKVSNGSSQVETDSPFQLSSYGAGSAPVVTLNSQYNLSTEVLSATKLKINLNSSPVITLINNQGASSLFLTIRSLSNPYFISQTFCIIKTYVSGGFLKQTLRTGSVPILIVQNTELRVVSDSVITLLEVNNTISLQISSISSKKLLSASYPFITQLYMVLKAPFSCSNLNSSNQLLITLPTLSTSNIIVTLTQCALGYFQDYTQAIQVKEYAKFLNTAFTIANLSTTTSKFAIKSTCGDQCHLCDPATLKCFKCFNSTHNFLNYLLPAEGKCYETCPPKTFGNGFTCQDCNEVCEECTDQLYTSCTKCAVNFIKNSLGVCESTCGAGFYLQGNSTCQQCNPNCQGCHNFTHCFSCKPGAILINSTCVFSQCQSPCETCEGSMQTCLTCVSDTETEYYLHESKCLSQCPSDTFKWEDDTNPSKVCRKIESANIYFVGLVLSVIVFGIGMGIRCFAPKKAKLYRNEGRDELIKTTKVESKLNETLAAKFNQSSLARTYAPLRKSIFSSQTPQKLYKLNILRFMTVLMGYIEVVCVVVILVQGGSINPKGVNELIAVGLVGLFVTNLVFGVRYYKNVYVKLMAKRAKFIEVNLTNKKELGKEIKDPAEMQIEPQPLQQAVEQPVIVQLNDDDVNLQPVDNKPPTQPENKTKILLYSQKSSQLQSITQEQKERLRENRKLLADFDNEMTKELLVAGLSTIFTLRSYNILRSNLFVIFESTEENGPVNRGRRVSNSFAQPVEEPNMASYSALRIPDKVVNEPIEVKKNEPTNRVERKNTLSKNVKKTSVSEKEPNVVKVQTKNMKLPLKTINKTQRSNKSNQSQPKPIPQPVINQPTALQITIPEITFPSPIPNPLMTFKTETVNKFYHPFYTYIMFASLFLVSLMFGVGASILVFKSRYENMMIWGIDALIVVAVGFFLNLFDLWKVVNLAKHERESELGTEKSEKNEINETMENLKGDDETKEEKFMEMKVEDEGGDNDINDLNATKKINIPVKMSSTLSIKPSASKKKPTQLKSPINENEIQIRSKSVSPKSPSQKSDKTRVFRSKLKGSKQKSGDDIQYIDEKPPELKIFDDLQIEDGKRGNNSNKMNTTQVSHNKHNRTANQLSKMRSSQGALINGRKTQMSSALIQGESTRGKGKNYKLDDIYIGFLQPSKGVPEREKSQNQQGQSQENDEIETVKLESRETVLGNMRQESKVEVDQEQEVVKGGKELRIIERAKKDENEQSQDLE